MGRGRGDTEADNILHGETTPIRRPDGAAADVAADRVLVIAPGPGRPLYKTQITIWSEFDGTSVELSDLAREAEIGDAYCSKSASRRIDDPGNDPDWDGTDFFGLEGEDDLSS